MSPDYWMPHGHCYGWTPDVLVPTLAGHGATIVAYAGLPICLLIVVRMLALQGRPRLLAVLFAAFILSCGAGHALEVLSIWRPHYHLVAWWHVATGLISLATLNAVIAAIVQRRAIVAWVRANIESPDLAAQSALSNIVHGLPALHVLVFKPDDDGAPRYTDGTAKIYEHMDTAPLEVAGRLCEEWLTEIGAGDIFPLYARVIAGDAVAFRYEHGPSGARSVTTITPYRGGGLVVSTMVDEIDAAYQRAPTVAEILGAS